MTYYHVLIYSSAQSVHPDAKVWDWSIEQLRERVVDLYQCGDFMMIDGIIHDPSELYRIRVYASECSAKEIHNEIVERKRGNPLDNTVTYTDVLDHMQEVTNEIIIAPPSTFTKANGNLGAIKNKTDLKTVFVVHGRNTTIRKSMFAFLRALCLHPLEWSQALSATGKTSPYIGDVLDVAFDMAQAIVVLFTPDDEARLREEFHGEREPLHETELTPQARPNVIFEAGMAMGRSPDRTVLVEVGELRPFTDVGGRHVVRFDGSPESRQDLAIRLSTAGCNVNMTGMDWLDVGDFKIASPIDSSKIGDAKVSDA